MKLEFGLRQGLAVDMQWDKRINDLRYQQQMKRQADIEMEAKAKMFADDLEYATPMNSHDNPLANGYAKQSIQKLGQFVNENPGWESNVTLRMQYNQLKRQLKDNPELNRGMQSDKGFDDMAKFAADPKNSNILSSSRWKSIEEQKRNYELYGNQNGEEAAKKEGKKAFMFMAPDPIQDMRAKALTIGSKLGTTDIGMAGGHGAKMTIVEDKKIKDSAIAELTGPDKDDWKLAWENESPSVKTLYGDDEDGRIKWAFDLIKAGTSVKKDWGQQWQQTGSSSRSGGSGGDFITPFMRQIAMQKEGSSPFTAKIAPLTTSVDGNKTVYAPPVSGLKVLTKNAKGEEIYKTVYGYSGEQLESTPTHNFKTVNGKKMVELNVKVPLRRHLTEGPNAVFTSKNSFGAMDIEDFDVMDGHQSISYIEKDGEGKPTGFGYLKVWADAITEEGNILAYDKAASGQSNANEAYMPTIGALSENDRARKAAAMGATQRDEAGNYFDANGNYIKVD